LRRGNGDGSIFKLSGKRRKPYAVRITKGWTDEGKQIYAYIGYFKTKTEAKKHLNNYLANPYDLTKITTLELYEKWVVTAKFSETVLKNYKRVIENSGLSKKVFKDISLMELEESARELTPAMQKRYKAAFKNLYLYAMKHDLVSKDLASLMELDKYKAKERDAITPADIKKMLNDDDIIPKLLLYTGMRIDELLSIETENVDLESRIMIGGLKTEAGKNRKIPIHKDILPIIEELYNKGYKYLLTNGKGRKITYINYLKEWHTNEVRTKYTPHYTRHTFVSRAIKLNLDRSILQKVVGHANQDVTALYTHLDNEQLLDFIDGFNY
jgi:integrase